MRIQRAVERTISSYGGAFAFSFIVPGISKLHEKSLYFTSTHVAFEKDQPVGAIFVKNERNWLNINHNSLVKMFIVPSNIGNRKLVMAPISNISLLRKYQSASAFEREFAAGPPQWSLDRCPRKSLFLHPWQMLESDPKGSR